MGRRQNLLEKRLAELSAVRSRDSDVAAAMVRGALSERSALVVARAAEIAVELHLEGLDAELSGALRRFLTDSDAEDPRCQAKAGLARALCELGGGDSALFLLGIRCVQLEPEWQRAVDTAAELRGLSGLGLVYVNYPEVVDRLAELLADPEPHARGHAARALAESRRPEGAPLLRFKIITGDEDVAVTGECMTALLHISGAGALDLIDAKLEGGGELAQHAAISLGQSRLPEVLPRLERWTDACTESETRWYGLLAMAMLRNEAAFDALLERVARSEAPIAKEAISALATYRHDGALRERVEKIVKKRRDRSLAQSFAEIWPPT